MIDSLIHKHKLIILTIFLGLIPLGCSRTTLTRQSCTEANTKGCVKISNWWTEGNNVHLRVKVLNESNIPKSDLNPSDFRVVTADASEAIEPTVILPKAEGAKATPADFIILLDMSGSMKYPDAQQVKKLDGAINAIREFLNAVERENLSVNISLVPFGESGAGCPNKDGILTVTEQKIKSNFLPATDNQLKTQLNDLAKVNVCAATNLYAPLETAVKYLNNESVTNGNSSTNEPIKKQLAVILLSDGFHTYKRATESLQFEGLKKILQQSAPYVTVHTLGYGESLSELYKKSLCQRLIIPEELSVDALIENKCQQEDNPNTVDIDESKINISEFLVDQPRLEEIAKLTGGIHQFPDNAQDVANSLITFLESLREYELIYKQPGADQATLHHSMVKIIPNNLTSGPVDIRMGNMDYVSLNLTERLYLMAGVLILFVLIGALPFMQWSRYLKQEK